MKYIIFPVALIASVATIIWLIIPTYQQAVQIRDVELVSARQKLAEEQEINKTIASLKEDHDLREDDLRIVKYALPINNEVEPYLVQLEAILTESGAYYKNIDFEGQGDVDMPQATGLESAATPAMFPLPETLTATINFTGSYDVISQVVTRVESLNRLSNITSLSIKKAEKLSTDAVEEENSTPTSDTLDATMTIEFYKQETINSEMIRSVFETASAGPAALGEPGATIE